MELKNLEEFKKLNKIATDLTKKFNRYDLKDDFVQYAAEKLIKGRKAQVKHLFVDFIREEIGDPRWDTSRSIKFGNSKELNETMFEPVIDEYNLDFKKIVNSTEENERSILILYFQLGYTMKEIGQKIGVSEGRVSQKFSEIMFKLNKKYGNIKNENFKRNFRYS
jgi:RNA polymerase sigma factor (sigma-70 family)